MYFMVYAWDLQCLCGLYLFSLYDDKYLMLPLFSIKLLDTHSPTPSTGNVFRREIGDDTIDNEVITFLHSIFG